MTVSPESPETPRRRLAVNLAGTGVLVLIAVAMWNWQPGRAPGAPAVREPKGPVVALDRWARRLPELPSPGSAARTTAAPDGASAAHAKESAATVAAASPEPSEARVAESMRAWRLAILNKSAEQVEALDQAFANHQSAFTAALMESAGSDPEARVRAFSTRVLGKLRAPESRTLMHRLLGDGSAYVRFNAAWAIGELADRDAMAELQRLAERDGSQMVRQAAHASLRRLNGS